MENIKERLKMVFDSLKEKGFFKNYNSYEDWSAGKEKKETPPAKPKELSEEELSKRKLEEFKDSMPPEEKEQFETVFGSDA